MQKKTTLNTIFLFFLSPYLTCTIFTVLYIGHTKCMVLVDECCRRPSSRQWWRRLMKHCITLSLKQLFLITFFLLYFFIVSCIRKIKTYTHIIMLLLSFIKLWIHECTILTLTCGLYVSWFLSIKKFNRVVRHYLIEG